jgi:hypothetical protein
MHFGLTPPILRQMTDAELDPYLIALQRIAEEQNA